MGVTLRSVPGTEAALGWAGAHSLVVDRPAGRAGGQGLGFNGGQLLALAIGGCLCNDLHYAAHALGVRLATVEVDVSLQLDGEPLLVTGAEVTVVIRAADAGADVVEIIRRAEADSTVSNLIARGVPVRLRAGG